MCEAGPTGQAPEPPEGARGSPVPDATATRRPRSPRGQGDRLREELLDAAGRLLAFLDGEDALSLRAVAREAGVAAPSVYLHFPDKSALVRAALSAKYARLADLLRSSAAEGGADALARLCAQARAYCRFGLEHPGHYRLMYGALPLAEGSRDHPARLVLEPLADAVEACDREGITPRLPGDRAVLALWAGLHGVVCLWRALPDGRCAGMVERVIDDLVALLFERSRSDPEPDA